VAKTCSVAVNGRTFKAKAGDVLLDAALANGIAIPHDCRSGHCGSCLARVRSGSTILGEAPMPGMVYACKARILSNLEVETEEVPEARIVNGFVREIRRLVRNVLEVTIAPEQRLNFLPGQYFNFKFAGFPARSYSATRPLDRRPRATAITLHIERLPEGRVSGELGGRIGAGHSAVIEGPYGHAFFRKGRSGRLILISSGTGFAPLWGIACAALKENPEREILLLTGLGTADPVYMAAGLERLASFPNVEIIVTIGQRPGLSEFVREGYPTDHLPSFHAGDIAYACGSPRMLETLSPILAASRVEFYTDPFEPARPDGQGFLEGARHLKQMLVPNWKWRLPPLPARPFPYAGR
jgi:CDP-4-dehydro-6-deoxyglucose reductase, E3